MKHLLGAPLYDKLLASLVDIRLGWKDLPGTNNVAVEASSQPFCLIRRNWDKIAAKGEGWIET